MSALPPQSLTPLDRRAARVFLRNIFDSHTTGVIALAFKVHADVVGTKKADGTRKDYYIPKTCRADDQYGWMERKFEWPAEREVMLDEIADRMREDLVKVMISPALFADKSSRGMHNIKAIRVVHLDYDAHGQRMDSGLLKQLLSLKPLIVKSGSPHCFHAYAGVAGLTLDDHHKLNTAFVRHFGGDSKTSPNDLLSLPGTYNIKNRENPAQVKIVGLS